MCVIFSLIVRNSRGFVLPVQVGSEPSQVVSRQKRLADGVGVPDVHVYVAIVKPRGSGDTLTLPRANCSAGHPDAETKSFQELVVVKQLALSSERTRHICTRRVEFCHGLFVTSSD